MTDLLAPELPDLDWRQLAFARGVTALLVAGGVIATPYASLALTPLPGYMPIILAAMAISNFLLAALLLVKGRIEQRPAAVYLGGAYLFVWLMMMPQIASFPGALAQTQLIGGPSTAAWLRWFWQVGFAIAIIGYTRMVDRAEVARPSVIPAIGVAIAAAGLATFAAVYCVDLLPVLLSDGKVLFAGKAAVFPLIALSVSGIAVIRVGRVRHPSLKQLWLTIGLVAACLDIWLTWQGGARFTLGWYIGKVIGLFSALAVLVALFHDIVQLYGRAAASNRVLVELAHKDGLTGLANRRYFDDLLLEEFRRARRQELPLGLVVIDLDCFKAYNDRYGHLEGDDCLRRVCATVQTALRRPGDRAARYGGEEIVVLLPATGESGALNVADAIREAVAALGIPHSGNAHGIVTVSAGASALIPFHAEDQPADLFGAADRALYQAKNAGRNLCCLVRARTQSDHTAPVVAPIG
jgi:diguanylate cyclase (GGDEF)-like protein